jgi:hypothetical protein
VYSHPRSKIVLAMAIIEVLPGLKIRIRVESELATEYFYDDDDVKLEDLFALSYIESKPGLAFSICLDWDERFLRHPACDYDMAAHIYVDGSLTNRRTYPRHRIRDRVLDEIKYAEDFQDDLQILRRFIFAKAVIG